MYDKMRKNIKKERIMEDSAQKNQIKETVNQLYALRAGLSLVDKEHDKANETENTAKAEKEKFVFKISGLTHINELNKKDLQYSAQKEKELLSNIEANEKSINRKKIALFVCAGIFGVCIFLFGVAFIVDLYGLYDASTALAVIPMPFGIASIVVAIINAVRIMPQIQMLKTNKQKYQQECKSALEISGIKEEIKSNDFEITTLEHEMESYISNATKEIAAFSQKGVEMYSLVAEEFSKSLPSLDQRDYKHVDLIIYLLETGRAETMKEALQQVDSYVSTDRIVQEISRASKTISQSITINMQSIRASIESSMYGLGEKIDRLTYNVNELNNNQQSNAKIQNALLEKANVSSSQMTKNIEQMRKYADEAYIKNANKW